jgi:putative flippase GtrA
MTLTWEEVKAAWLRNYRSFFKYVFVGGSTFLLDISLLIFLKEVGGWHVITAATASYWASIGYNFLLNRQWTFDTTRSLRRHAFAYGLLLATNYAVTIGIITGLGALGIKYTIAKVLAVGLSATWTYVIYKKVIFV